MQCLSQQQGIRQQHLQHTDISKSRDAWVYLVQQQQVIANIRGFSHNISREEFINSKLLQQGCSVAGSRWTRRMEVVTSARVGHLYGCSATALPVTTVPRGTTFSQTQIGAAVPLNPQIWTRFIDILPWFKRIWNNIPYKKLHRCRKDR